MHRVRQQDVAACVDCVEACACVCVCPQLARLCDMLIVDGGHEPETAMLDTLNMRALARRDFNIFV